MAHEPDPLHHVQDAHDKWTFFEELMDFSVALPRVKIGEYEFQVTKFMILEVVAAVLILLIYLPIAWRARNGDLPRGRWWNAFEALLTFVRDNIVRPNFPAGEGDRFVPFFWTLFLFILVNNLLGMVPFLGSPTSSIWVTGGLAVISFLVMHGAAIAKVGLGTYLKSMWPTVDAPYIGVLISALIFVIELVGSVIKSGVLAIRLFANMFAGHMVLAYILMFIWMAKDLVWLWPLVTLTSVFGVVALSLLELFVAFLQAYVFVFLTALFVGMSLEHALHAAHAGHEHEHGTEHEPVLGHGTQLAHGDAGHH